jgi:hypothetical protein
MVSESGREHSLPLLPSGTTLFDGLPAGAVVLDALAPAVGDGVITVRDDARTGILVIRAGGIADALTIDGGVRAAGASALTSIAAWRSAKVSACRLSDDAMALLGPLLRGEPRYTDLRLEWTVWAELLRDLRSRGGTFVVELCTPAGHGVTLIRDGQQVATYTDSHPSLGGAELIDALAAGGTGEVRVLVEPNMELSDTPRAVPSDVLRAAESEVSRAVPSDAPRAAESDASDAVPSDAPRAVEQPSPAWLGSGSDTPAASTIHVLDRSRDHALTEASTLLPDLKLLVRKRLQRSSGSVEEVIEQAAAEGQSLEWLADEVRAMRVRGFMPATFERLADDMLSLADRTSD